MKRIRTGTFCQMNGLHIQGITHPASVQHRPCSGRNPFRRCPATGSPEACPTSAAFAALQPERTIVVRHRFDCASAPATTFQYTKENLVPKCPQTWQRQSDQNRQQNNMVLPESHRQIQTPG